MNVPSTYAEWVPLLKQFAETPDLDPKLLPILESGTISWSDGLAQKFANRCGDAMMTRLDDVQKKYNTEIGSSQGSIDGMIAANVSVRRRLIPLVRFSRIQGFHEELRNYLQENLKNVVKEMQEALEKDLEEKAKHSTIQADILVAIRKNPIRLPFEDESEVSENLSRISASNDHTPSFEKKKKRLLF